MQDVMGIPVTILQFGRLRRQDTTVRGFDISDGGIGVVSDVPLAPGFVWFWTKVEEYNGGMLLWSRKIGDKYRAGIQFLDIPDDWMHAPPHEG